MIHIICRWYGLSKDDWLRSNRWDTVYPYIESRWWLDWYIKNFHDRVLSRFDNYTDALHGLDEVSNKDSVILTAWK